MFDADQLRSFTMVAECGGFTRAAERLNSTQSTISFQIKRLEERVGRPLLARSTRRVTLTPEGEILLGYARGILRLQEAAQRQLSGTAMEGTVRLGTSEDFASGGLARALALFRRVHPRVRLEVHVGISRALLPALDAGELDLVLGKRCAGDQRGEMLWHEPLVWAFARDADVETSSPLPLAFFPEPCVYREAAINALSGKGQAFEIVYVSPSFSGVKAAAAAGLAMTPLPASVMTPDLRAVEPHEGAPPLPDGEFVLFRRRNHSSSMSEESSALVEELARSLRAVRL